MKSVLFLALLCGGTAAALKAAPCVGALAEVDPAVSDVVSVRQTGKGAPAKLVAVPAQPRLTEEQALHALETEVSRKVGLQMKDSDYPAEAWRWTWGGTTLVHVLVTREGYLRHICVGKTSGFRILDEQAVRIVSRVSAPSWIPERLRGRDVPLMVPIGFILPRRN